MNKKIFFAASVAVLFLFLGACSRDTAGQAYEKMSKEAVEKVCTEQPDLCSCLKEKKNLDLCLCVKKAGTDYLMQDDCYAAYTPGQQREQGKK